MNATCLRKDAWIFLLAAKNHWKEIVGGSLLFLLIGVAASMGLNIPPAISAIAALCLAFSMACFLCWRDQYREAERLTALIKPRIQVSCGRSVDKSIVHREGKYWFRARLDLDGITAIPDIEGRVTDVLEDGRRTPLPEYLTLTMHPGMTAPYPADRNMKTLVGGCPEFVDVIHVTQDGLAIFPCKFYPGAVDASVIFKPAHTYQIRVALTNASQFHPTIMCVFEFEWTGDPDKSDIRLISATPSSSDIK